jgi:HEPN domain-containing protein
VTVESTGQSPFPSDFSANLLDQVFRLWVEPAVAERGLGFTRSDVMKALVVMPPSDVPKVYINDEVQLIAQVRAARSIQIGEAVTLEDISSVEGLRPANVDGNAGWITFAKIGNEITIAFDFRRNRQTASLLVERAAEFAEAAEGSLVLGHLGPAIENAFAAAELAVKAEMFLIEDQPTTKHPERVAWWTEWERLGNAPPGASRVLRELYSERGASRYGDRPISMPHDHVRSAIVAVRQIIGLARARCVEQQPPV